MTDRNLLSFPSPDADDGHDAELAERLAALYPATPEPSAFQIAQCVQYVLDRVPEAGVDSGTDPYIRAVGNRRPESAGREESGHAGSRWWWGAAAAAVLVTASTFLFDSNRQGGLNQGPLAMSTDVATVDALSGSVTALSDNDVRFILTLDSDVQEVAIVGDFNGWDESATPMARANGAWSAHIPLPPGRHVYAFVVNGQRWVVDPMAPQVPNDGFGPTNAVVIDGGPL